MTLRLYAERKQLPLRRATVRLRHQKVHARDCAECETRDGRVDVLERRIALEGALDAEQRRRLLEIADKCPVHRTLEGEIKIRTGLDEPAAGTDFRSAVGHKGSDGRNFGFAAPPKVWYRRQPTTQTNDLNREGAIAFAARGEDGERTRGSHDHRPQQQHDGIRRPARLSRRFGRMGDPFQPPARTRSRRSAASARGRTRVRSST